jgi:hypothetical protein
MNQNREPFDYANKSAYSSTQEMTHQMSHPDYKSNPAARAVVAERIAAAVAGGVDLNLRVIDGNTGKRVL